MIDNSIGYGNPNYQTPTPRKGWASFALGGMTTFLLIYVGIARPASDELSKMRDEIRSLQKSVAMVAGQRDAVDETNHLLAQLSQQQTQAHAARKTLVEMRDLTNSLLAESHRVQDAATAVNQLASIKDLLIANTDDVARATEALDASESIHDRLTASASLNEEALRASLDLLAMRNEVLSDRDRNEAATAALGEMVAMRDSLEQASQSTAMAQDRVDDLIQLKNSVIAQTNDLAASIETLELTQELGDRFRLAASSFKSIRDWMIEMVAFEPTFAHVRQILEPMNELVNLKRMDPTQIRDYAQAFVRDSKERLASKSSSIVSHRSPSDNPIAVEAPSDSSID